LREEMVHEVFATIIDLAGEGAGAGAARVELVKARAARRRVVRESCMVAVFLD
jgi:hypothetical protein